MPRSRCYFAAVTSLAILIATPEFSQTVSPGAATANPGSREPTLITGVKVVQDHGQPAVEIDSTRPVIPAIQSLDNPPRLVIELPSSRSGMPEKKIPVLQGNILTIRIEPSRASPPGLKIILTFLIPHTFTWDSEGNRLMVRLKPPEDPYAAGRPGTERPKDDQPKEEQPKVFSAQSEKEPAVVPVTSGVGDVLLAGRRFAAGSSLTAGGETAVLQLTRGGQIHVCPGTTLSVTPSKNSKDLMLGLSTGALETHYALAASADTVLTPDFRVVFRGPGEFDYAISSDSKGDTCVRGLRGNAGSAAVSELIGDRTYQVKPNEQSVFRAGRIDRIDTNVPLECGCPPPVPVMRADASSPNLVHDSDSANVTLAQGDAAASNSGRPENHPANAEPENHAAAAPGGSGMQPLPHDNSEIHVQVEAPLVFEGKNIPPASAAVEQATALPATDPSRFATLEATALPPAASEAKPEHHGIMGRIRGFFARIFQ